MEYRAVYLGCDGEAEISRWTTPEFWRLYRRSVLLALGECGALDDGLLRLCLDMEEGDREAEE